MLSLLLVVALPIHAAPAQKQAEEMKQRSLKSLVKISIENGYDRTIDPSTSANLGWTRAKTAARAVRYKKNDSPDGREHVFSVVLSEGRPQAIMWAVTFSTITAEGKFLEGKGYRLSMKGKLQAAMIVEGKVGELKQRPRPIDSSEVRIEFEKERAYWTIDSVLLPLTYTFE